jgi:DNA repair photolyase
MEAILEKAHAAGASVAGYTLLRLPLELKALFREWLQEHFPDKAAHVLSLVAQCHGGRLYESAWSKRMVGGGPYADMLAARFDRACRRLGFAPRSNDRLDSTRFRPPPQKGDQLALF